MFSLYGLISMLLIGLIVGWLAAAIMKENNLGWGKSILLGIIGSAVGNFIFRMVGISAFGWIGQIILGVIGACLVLYLFSRLKRQ